MPHKNWQLFTREILAKIYVTLFAIISDFSIRREVDFGARTQFYILQYYLYVLYTPFPSHVLLNLPLLHRTTSMLFTRCFSFILNLSVGVAKSFQSVLRRKRWTCSRAFLSWKRSGAERGMDGKCQTNLLSLGEPRNKDAFVLFRFKNGKWY